MVVKKKKISRKSRALEYAAHGFRVLPLYTIKDGNCTCAKGKSCNHAGKHPRTNNGHEDATTDLDRIKEWRWSDANIGIATGRGSGILVLDIDPRNGGTATLQRLGEELGPLPETATSQTGGGGEHRIFEYPNFPVRKDSAGKVFGPGIDVLSNGSIAVAPPSRHVSGNRYRWAEGKSFRDLEPASLPEPWLDRLRGSTEAQPDTDSPAAKSERVVPEGQRNPQLTSLAGTLQRSGAAPKTIKAALIAENKAKCSPPLDKSEVNGIVASVRRYA